MSDSRQSCPCPELREPRRPRGIPKPWIVAIVAACVAAALAVADAARQGWRRGK